MLSRLDALTTATAALIVSMLTPPGTSLGDLGGPHSPLVDCSGCHSTACSSDGYTNGAKVFINTQGFSLTGSFSIEDDGGCFWGQLHQNGPYSCLQSDTCQFRGTFIAYWDGTYCMRPPTESKSGLTIGSTQVIECQCGNTQCDGEGRSFSAALCTEPEGVLLGDIVFRGECSGCTQVQPPG